MIYDLFYNDFECRRQGAVDTIWTYHANASDIETLTRAYLAHQIALRFGEVCTI